MHTTPSSIRVNPGVLLSAFFLSCMGYYIGRLSTEREPTSNAGGLEWTVPGAERVTITVEGPQVTVHAPTATVTVSPEPKESVVLNGPPADTFLGNLRPEVKYITTWPGTGFTNEVMSFMNMIYLAILTERVPIMPFFAPSHIALESSDYIPDIDFGQVFDAPRLAKSLRIPVLEWWQVKDRNSTTVEPLGCWNVWQAVSPNHYEHHPTRGSPERMNLDISWTIAPKWIKVYNDENADDEYHMKFSALMALAFPEQRSHNLGTPSTSPLLGMSLPPNEQLFCLDSMYWTSNLEAHEFEHDYSTAWRFVGKYLHWNPRIEELARVYLRRAFGLAPGAPLPHYIAIHVRRGDFADWCPRTMPVDECFAPLSAYARRVEEVREELQRARGIEVQRVVLTSDETNAMWWEEVAAYGWHRIDHSTTVATHSAWHPVLIDAAIQSASIGFVGTDLSTVSLMADLRVKAWQDGVVRSVKWGKLGADDH
ncbi:hypothetical protein B0H14DRAFT_2527669 [Mycena olivaceomarginata]|nr:hypothetical protein B0H14DRAFT_2527669 [Mycena olivaceomarginata]